MRPSSRCNLFIIVLITLFTACAQPPTATPIPTTITEVVASTDTIVPTDTAVPTHTAAPSATPTATAVATMTIDNLPLTIDNSPTPTSPPPTPKITTPPKSPSPVPTPIPPTPIPLAANPLSPENASQIEEIGRLGWGMVDRVRFSPDGLLLAVATSEGIYLHDANTNLRQLAIASPSPIVAFTFAPDGQTMASGHDDRRVRIWRVSDGALLQTITTDHQRQVWSVAFSPDGQSIVTSAAEESGLINLWRVSDGSKIRQFSGHSSRVRDVVFSPDGQMIASASIDWTIGLWRVADGTRLHTLRGHQGIVWRVAFTPDGTTLTSVGNNGELRTWRVSDGFNLTTVSAHESFASVSSLSISNDGTMMVTGADDGDIKVWDIDGTWIDTLFTFVDIDDVTLSPDGRYLAAAIGGGQVSIYALPFSQITTYPVNYDTGAVSGLAYTPDGRSLSYGAPYQLGVATLADEWMWQGQIDSSAREVVHDPYGRYLAVSLDDQGILLLDPNSYNELSRLQTDTATNSDAIALAVSSDGEQLMAVWSSGEPILYDVMFDDGIPQLVPALYTDTYAPWVVRDAALSDDLIVWNVDNIITRYNYADETITQNKMTHPERILAVAFSPDGRILASGDEGGNIYLWPDAFDPLATPIILTGHDNRVDDLAFSPDGRLLASVSLDRTVRLWDVADGRLLTTLTGHQLNINQVTFSPDGAVLATGSGDRTIRFWGLP